MLYQYAKRLHLTQYLEEQQQWFLERDIPTIADPTVQGRMLAVYVAPNRLWNVLMDCLARLGQCWSVMVIIDDQQGGVFGRAKVTPCDAKDYFDLFRELILKDSRVSLMIHRSDSELFLPMVQLDSPKLLGLLDTPLCAFRSVLKRHGINELSTAAAKRVGTYTYSDRHTPQFQTRWRQLVGALALSRQPDPSA
jgi:hypothetical protein